ncbi:MAG: type IV toxin-antitoxin system AbiEi family antitoxin domain-containing protein [Bacteroidales bacterium]|nr:type IV toxin-antitoxin system AbiEi family antitoxin domain-containing protein [Bacteroidales bacterium]
MSDSVEIKVFNKIKKAKRGTLFFTDSFASTGDTKAVSKALERLVKSKEIYRVARGMYARPKIDKYIGIVLPGIDEIALAIAKRDKARIIPTGSYAMYKLGLTTQVPMNIVYYTDASARKIKIDNQIITFKKASAKNLAYIGNISKLAVQALRNIGKNNVTDEELKKIRGLLKNEKPYHLQHDLNIAPHWIRKLLNTDKSNE